MRVRRGVGKQALQLSVRSLPLLLQIDTRKRLEGLLDVLSKRRQKRKKAISIAVEHYRCLLGKVRPSANRTHFKGILAGHITIHLLAFAGMYQD